MVSMIDLINKAVGPVHNFVYRRSAGRIGGKIGKAPVLLLTTTGRHSGKSRTHPLLFIHDGDGYVVAASNGGQDHAPGWYHNVATNPLGWVEVDGRTQQVRAEILAPERSTQLWPQFDAMYKGYSKYREKTARSFPLVRLGPVGS